MKKIYYIASCLILLLLSLASCGDKEVEYDTTDLESNAAEYQLHYVAPVTSSAANYINQVLLDGTLVSNSYAPLKPSNFIPSGGTSRFYKTTPGTKTLQMYTGSTTLTEVYNQQMTLTSGKQNVIVYDLTKAPAVFDNEYPYTANLTANTDSTAWVKFFNFMYENTTTPTTLKLQYKCYCMNPSTNKYTDTVAVGKPVAFGETTGWQPVKVLKSAYNSSGYCSVYYLIDIIDANGNAVGSLQITNSSNKVVNYSDYWTTYIGRRYMHILKGIRTNKTYTVAVNVSTEL